MRLPRRTCKARALPVFRLDTFRAHAVVEQESSARRPGRGRGQAGGKARLAAVRAVYRAAIVYADACKSHQTLQVMCIPMLSADATIETSVI